MFGRIGPVNVLFVGIDRLLRRRAGPQQQSGQERDPARQHGAAGGNGNQPARRCGIAPGISKKPIKNEQLVVSHVASGTKDSAVLQTEAEQRK
ncbi:MAG: hypothetical protein LC637_14720 [Xanthomonadaceae bacterium]|nr:hypothetical protein [Xanthomonadaceae bacterium]